MKKLFIFLFISFSSFAQDEKSINLNIKEVKDTDVGVFPLGKGAFVYQSYMTSLYDFTTTPKRKNATMSYNKKKGIEEVAIYAKDKYAEHEITNTAFNFTSFRMKIFFNLKNEDGSPYLVREEALKELKQIKELLDLGIITQEEFDKKAAIYKRVILN